MVQRHLLFMEKLNPKFILKLARAVHTDIHTPGFGQLPGLDLKKYPRVYRVWTKTTGFGDMLGCGGAWLNRELLWIIFIVKNIN